jgi:hypothetical protein
MKAPPARPEAAPAWLGSAARIAEIGDIEGSGAMISPVPPPAARRKTPAHASFHDAAAREVYASRFRPIAFPAVAAGTRSRSETLKEERAEKRDIPAILRHGFDD